MKKSCIRLLFVIDDIPLMVLLIYVDEIGEKIDILKLLRRDEDGEEHKDKTVKGKILFRCDVIESLQIKSWYISSITDPV